MGFIITDFARVPTPEPQLQHQSNRMDIAAYLIKEGSAIQAGTPIVRLENWWAVFELITNVPAKLEKNLYDWAPGISLSVGSEIALLSYSEGLPQGACLFSTRVVSIKRMKGDQP
jgi:hypothetical protein